MTEQPIKPPTITTIELDGGGEMRIDSQGRILCNARRTDKEPCNGPAVAGLRVCRVHGARAPRAREAAKQRLADLVDPSIEKLGGIIARPETKDSDRLRAIDSVLDRTGYGRSQTVDTTDAKERLRERLIEMAGGDVTDDSTGDEASAVTGDKAES